MSYQQQKGVWVDLQELEEGGEVFGQQTAETLGDVVEAVFVGRVMLKVLDYRQQVPVLFSFKYHDWVIIQLFFLSYLVTFSFLGGSGGSDHKVSQLRVLVGQQVGSYPTEPAHLGAVALMHGALQSQTHQSISVLFVPIAVPKEQPRVRLDLPVDVRHLEQFLEAEVLLGQQLLEGQFLQRHRLLLLLCVHTQMIQNYAQSRRVINQLWQEQAIILARSWKLNSMPQRRWFSSRNSWNCSASPSVRLSPNSIRYFLASLTDILTDLSASERLPVSLWMPSKASMISSSMVVSLVRAISSSTMPWKVTCPTSWGSSCWRMVSSSAWVGQWPSPRTKRVNWEVGMVPLSSLSKMEKSSWQWASSSLLRDWRAEEAVLADSTAVSLIRTIIITIEFPYNKAYHAQQGLLGSIELEG